VDLTDSDGVHQHEHQGDPTDQGCPSQAQERHYTAGIQVTLGCHVCDMCPPPMP